jgi:hypothetical protein
VSTSWSSSGHSWTGSSVQFTAHKMVTVWSWTGSSVQFTAYKMMAAWSWTGSSVQFTAYKMMAAWSWTGSSVQFTAHKMMAVWSWTGSSVQFTAHKMMTVLSWPVAVSSLRLTKWRQLVVTLCVTLVQTNLQGLSCCNVVITSLGSSEHSSRCL